MAPNAIRSRSASTRTVLLREKVIGITSYCIRLVPDRQTRRCSPLLPDPAEPLVEADGLSAIAGREAAVRGCRRFDSSDLSEQEVPLVAAQTAGLSVQLRRPVKDLSPDVLGVAQDLDRFGAQSDKPERRIWRQRRIVGREARGRGVRLNQPHAATVKITQQR